MCDESEHNNGIPAAPSLTRREIEDAAIQLGWRCRDEGGTLNDALDRWHAGFLTTHVGPAPETKEG